MKLITREKQQGLLVKPRHPACRILGERSACSLDERSDLQEKVHENTPFPGGRCAHPGYNISIILAKVGIQRDA